MEEAWMLILKDYLENEHFQSVRNKVRDEYISKTIYPKPTDVFNAFNKTPFDKVKVVILGQDPYHGKGQAHGLSFSVPKGITAPPSLRNIFTELKNDIGKEIPQDGDLTNWAEQGVLLLNAILTVVANSPASHHNMGWEDFTDTVIKTISDKKENIVFILWGAYAQKKKSLIDTQKHLVIESPHPSPFSADRGFFGSKPFSKTNEYLKSKGETEINW